MTAAGPTRTRPQRSQSADGQVLGLLLLLGGVAWLLDRAEVVELSWVTVVSVLLLVLGVGMVVTARRRGGPGLFLLGIGMTVVLAAASSVDLGLVGEGVDDRRLRALTLASAERQSETQGELFAGQLTIDLTSISEVPEETVLRYRLGFGHLVLRLPPEEDVPVEIHTSVRGGKVELFDQPLRKGSNFDVDYEDKTETDRTKLEIQVTMGFGAVEVVRDGG